MSYFIRFEQSNFCTQVTLRDNDRVERNKVRDFILRWNQFDIDIEPYELWLWLSVGNTWVRLANDGTLKAAFDAARAFLGGSQVGRVLKSQYYLKLWWYCVYTHSITTVYTVLCITTLIRYSCRWLSYQFGVKGSYVDYTIKTLNLKRLKVIRSWSSSSRIPRWSRRIPY